MKKKLFNLLALAMLLISSSTFWGCKKDYSAEDVVKPPVVRDYNFIVRFVPKMDTSVLEFGKTYTNHFGESFSVSQLKFYLHELQLFNTDSNHLTTTGKEKHYLIDFSDTTTTVIKYAIYPYKYNRIGFFIGVDSSRNYSGAQTGALDPAKGMFWTWNSGYIMAKMEGNSPQANTPNNKFEFHIGGFSGTDNTVRYPILLFPFGETLEVKKDKVSEITIEVNVGAWFYNPHDIRIADHPVITTPGTLARQVSENYSKMCTVSKVINE